MSDIFVIMKSPRTPVRRPTPVPFGAPVLHEGYWTEEQVASAVVVDLEQQARQRYEEYVRERREGPLGDVLGILSFERWCEENGVPDYQLMTLRAL